MSEIRLVDVSIRDGNQSLWSMTGLDTRQILQIAPVIERVGFKAIDFTSSTHMAVAVRYHQDDPWQRIRLMHAALPTTPLQFISTGFRFMSWETADHDFMRLVYRKLMENGIGRFVLLDPMHDMDALIQVAKIVKEEGEAENMAALTYTISDVHDDAFYAGCAARIAQCPHFDCVYLKDPSGLLTPERARSLIPAIRNELGGIPLELHSHCTIGLSQFNYMTGADLGIDALHVAVGPLANGSSLPPADSTIRNLREHGHEVDVDEQALARMTEYFTALAEAEGLPAGKPQQYDARFMRHQIAGGVLTTTRRQLAELNQEDKFNAVMEEVERVRSELGSPIMVTPFPQIVCTQALLNIIGAERYDNVPDQVIKYVLGRFGRPAGAVDENVLDRIMSLPRTRALREEPAKMTLKSVRKRFPSSLSDEEFLLRAVLPEQQVNAMIKKDVYRSHYNPDVSPVLSLLRAVKQRPPLSHFVVEKPGFRLQLRAGADRASTAAGTKCETNDWRTNGEAIARLQAAKGFVFDLDGTLALGDRRNQGLIPEPGAVELLGYLSREGAPFVVFTNGTVRTATQYVPKLTALGFPVDESSMMTPSSVAADYFTRRNYRRIMVLGVEGVWQPLSDAGLEIVHPGGNDTDGVDAVFIGWYREFTMLDIEAACRAMEQGAGLYSASGTPFFRTAQGKAIGTSLAISAALEAITKCKTKVLGKPSIEALRYAGRRLGLPLSEIVVVGDDPLLEVPMALNGGSMAIYIDSGMGGEDAFANVPINKRPHLSLTGVDELLRLYTVSHA